MQLVIRTVFFLTLSTLAVISYQDFKWRAVMWPAFPILAIFSMVLAGACGSWTGTFTQALENGLFLALQFSVVALYLRVTRRSARTLFKIYTSLGDVLFLFAISFLFPLITFVVFYSASMLFSLLMALSMRWISKKREAALPAAAVPLAGYQSLFLILVLLYPVNRAEGRPFWKIDPCDQLRAIQHSVQLIYEPLYTL